MAGHRILLEAHAHNPQSRPCCGHRKFHGNGGSAVGIQNNEWPSPLLCPALFWTPTHGNPDGSSAGRCKIQPPRRIQGMARRRPCRCTREVARERRETAQELSSRSKGHSVPKRIGDCESQQTGCRLSRRTPSIATPGKARSASTTIRRYSSCKPPSQPLKRGNPAIAKEIDVEKRANLFRPPGVPFHYATIKLDGVDPAFGEGALKDFLAHEECGREIIELLIVSCFEYNHHAVTEKTKVAGGNLSVYQELKNDRFTALAKVLENFAIEPTLNIAFCDGCSVSPFPALRFQ